MYINSLYREGCTIRGGEVKRGRGAALSRAVHLSCCSGRWDQYMYQLHMSKHSLYDLLSSNMHIPVQKDEARSW